MSGGDYDPQSKGITFGTKRATERIIMFYHVLLRKFWDHSRSDEKVQMDWYFRSLSKALTMIKRDFESEAAYWHIEDKTERTSDIMNLEGDLCRALESGYQYIIMTLKEGVPALKDYDHYEFLFCMKDETLQLPTFSFTEKEEVSIVPFKNEEEGLVNLCNHPIDTNLIEAITPVHANGSNLFCGVSLDLKDGRNLFVFAGKNQKEESFNLLVNGIEDDIVEGYVRPSDKVPFRGLCVILFSGYHLYLTIGKLRPSQKNLAHDDIHSPDVRQSIKDILQSFEMNEGSDFVGRALKALLEFYGDEKDLPRRIREIQKKEILTPEDLVHLADMCEVLLDEERLAARLYVAAYYSEGEAKWRGKALVKLADLYMSSEWAKDGGREWDVMKAVDLLTEALTLGCVKEAKDSLEGMREQLFEEYEDEPDIDNFIRNYQADVLCLAAFCLGVGIGWKKDVPSATRLYEAALAQGYPRAAYYLKEIRFGRI